MRAKSFDTISLADLHDTVLDMVSVAWESGKITFDVRGYFDGQSIPVRLIAEGATKLSIPKENPWGPSASINKVETLNAVKGMRLLIEMQSGDVIETDIENYGFERG